MATTVRVNLNPVSKILADRKLNGQAQLFMSSEIHRLSSPYIPFDNNPLSTNVTITENSITYNVPYARYQWYGKVMVGSSPKQVTGKDLKYQGSPMRGAYWTNRAMADRGNDVANAVAKFIGGRTK